jgi:hypothetical protein
MVLLIMGGWVGELLDVKGLSCMEISEKDGTCTWKYPEGSVLRSEFDALLFLICKQFMV